LDVVHVGVERFKSYVVYAHFDSQVDANPSRIDHATNRRCCGARTDCDRDFGCDAIGSGQCGQRDASGEGGRLREVCSESRLV